MGLFRRRRVPADPEPPRGIILQLPDRGRVIKCIALREPDADEHGCAAWLAVPVEDVTIRPGEAFLLSVDADKGGCLPDGCVLYPGFSWDPDGAGTLP